jgi:outer membrane protein assembly factor BamB
MRFFKVLIILVIFQNCSFDNKTGIWKNENNIEKVEKNIFDELETFSAIKQTFNKIIPFKENFKFDTLDEKINSKWYDFFYNLGNNSENFKYSNTNQLIFKSKKITKHKIGDYILYDRGNIILSDYKGNIIVFSIKRNKIIRKINFYKKNYKKFKKVLNLSVDGDIIYVTDNIGYIYSYNYIKDKFLWAKNYKVPFRSNLKILDNKIVAANQNNNFYFFDKKDGEVLRLIPTEETIVKNKFINNIAANNTNIFFLNTYGSLYSFKKNDMRIEWFLNLNQSIDLNPNNLFLSSKIISYKDKIIVPTNEFLYVINSKNGSIIYKKNLSLLMKPLAINNYLFLINSNNLLIALDLEDGNFIYSYSINQKIADYLNTKKKVADLKNIKIANNQILVFLKNSYILKFNLNGELEELNKLPSKIKTNPIFIDKSILYLDFKNKVSIID